MREQLASLASNCLFLLDYCLHVGWNMNMFAQIEHIIQQPSSMNIIPRSLSLERTMATLLYAVQRDRVRAVARK
jgi:hypothetical protein